MMPSGNPAEPEAVGSSAVSPDAAGDALFASDESKPVVWAGGGVGGGEVDKGDANKSSNNVPPSRTDTRVSTRSDAPPRWCRVCAKCCGSMLASIALSAMM